MISFWYISFISCDSGSTVQNLCRLCFMFQQLQKFIQWLEEAEESSEEEGE